MANQAGWQNYLFIEKESDWGSGASGGEADILLPYETYDVIQKREVYDAKRYCGQRQRRHHHIPKRFITSGNLNCDMYGFHVASGTTKSVAQHLIDMAVSAPAGIQLDSFAAQKFEPNDPKYHEGLCINTMNIAGTSDGDGIIKLQFGLLGKRETTVSAPTLDVTDEHYRPFMFYESTFAIGGTAVEMPQFTLTLNNNVIVWYNNSLYPSLMKCGNRDWMYQFLFPKNSNAYDVIRRNGAVIDTPVTAQLVLKGLHLGSAAQNYTVCTIDIGRMQFGDQNVSEEFNALAIETIDYVILKPNSADNDVKFTWSTAA